MRRVLFRWRGVSVPSYPAMLYLGLVFGAAAGNWAANRARLPSGRVFAATFLLLVPALAGARLLFVASHWASYRDTPTRIWNRSQGGMAMYGGLLLAVPASVPLLAAFALPFWAFWDVATVTILIGMAFTRVGCLLNGCCAGRPTRGRFGLSLANHDGVWQRRIPTPLLEAAWGLCVLALTQLLGGPGAPAGTAFLLALGGYGLGRVVLERLREEQDRMGRVALQGAISCIFVATALVGLLVARGG
jgi:phosphatidylglycerol:prolipoprotein diacylglycerol transferase